MKLLFICTHNRCRSILAEAITRHVSGNHIIVASAGSSPQGAVHPLTLKFLQENNISIDGLKSQSWNEFENFEPDAVITLCDSAEKEACPVWFGQAQHVHWGLADPSKAQSSDAEQRVLFNNTIELLTMRAKALLNPGIPTLHSKESSRQLGITLRDIAERIH